MATRFRFRDKAHKELLVRMLQDHTQSVLVKPLVVKLERNEIDISTFIALVGKLLGPGVLIAFAKDVRNKNAANKAKVAAASLVNMSCQKRDPYKCGKCGMPKKKHVCRSQS